MFFLSHREGGKRQENPSGVYLFDDMIPQTPQDDAILMAALANLLHRSDPKGCTSPPSSPLFWSISVDLQAHGANQSENQKVAVKARAVLALWMDMAAPLGSVVMLAGPSPAPLLNTGVELGVVVVVGVVEVVGVAEVVGVVLVEGVAVGVPLVEGVVLAELALAGYTHPEDWVGIVAEVVAVPEKSQLPVVSPFFWK